ncbi:MAG: sulfatase-like hydrolase/transferase [candidate division Zixibacteria bacterium]|nr:sulfatase-like hydrolase/transferase [candidate division Zixibacteria bacterium]
MEISRKKSDFSIILTSVIGAVFTSGLVGLVESIILTISSGYERWTLPLTGVGYYSILGLIIGIALGIGLYLIQIISHRKTRIEIPLTCSSILAVTFVGIYPYINGLMGLIGIVQRDLIWYSVKSLLIILILYILFKIFSRFYIILLRSIQRPVTSLFIIYIVLLLSSGILAFVSPEKSHYNKPYNIEASLSVSNKPNIIFILVDCLRYDFISPDGYDNKTPAMQKLADDGVFFTNAIANCNWTKPAIASIFTSLIPRQHRVLTFFTPIPDNLVVTADTLSDLGYYTVAFSTNVNITKQTNFNKGFNEFYYLKGPSSLRVDLNAPQLSNHKLIEGLCNKLIPGIKKRFMYYRDAKSTTDEVIEWLENNDKSPFYMYLHYMDAHVPYYKHPYDGTSATPYQDDPSGDNVKLYESLYNGEIKYIDSHLLRLLSYFKENGLYDSSLIILTSDHGEEFFDHYGWEHAVTMYNEMIHLPLIIKLPGFVKAGTVNSALVSQIDYAPTILRHLGFTPPSSWHGNDIFDPNFYNNYVISQATNGSPGNRYRIHSIRTLEHKLMAADSGYSPERLYTYQGKPVDKRGAFPPNSFFDLISDPQEKVDLYNDDTYQSIIDSIEYIDSLELSRIPKMQTQQDTVTLDAETIKQLKALGYLE